MTTMKGRAIWVRTQAVAVVENGKTTRLEGTFQDITERKRAEAVLLDSEAKYRALLENVPTAVVVHGPDTVVAYSNPTASAVLGLTADQVQGKSAVDPYWQFLRQDGTPLPLDEYPVNKALSSGEPLTNMILGIRVAGHATPTWVMCNACPVRDTDGRIRQVIVSFVDITERRQAEAEKAALQARLLQAQKLESIGRLAGGVAHEFNNMLGVILGYTEMALDQVDPTEPLHADLERIRTAATRSADVTRQLLAFARKQIIAPRVLDLNETVAGALKMLGRLLGEHIQIAWQPAADLWPTKADPSQIGQMLTTVCLNARDAISGTGHLTIETGNTTIDAAYCAAHPEGVPGQYVRLAVGDDGCGMDQETLAKVFEPFFTTKDVGQGTGLGLPSVQGIVLQHGGFLTVSSTRASARRS